MNYNNNNNKNRFMNEFLLYVLLRTLLYCNVIDILQCTCYECILRYTAIFIITKKKCLRVSKRSRTLGATGVFTWEGVPESFFSYRINR